MPRGSRCCRGDGVAWEGCLSCSASLLPSTSASWRGGEGGRDKGGGGGLSPGQGTTAPSSGPEGLQGPRARRPPPAHLHGSIGCFCRLLPCVVDESAASLWQHPDEADLPKAGGWSVSTHPRETTPPPPHASLTGPGAPGNGDGCRAWDLGTRTATQGRTGEGLVGHQGAAGAQQADMLTG